MKQSALQKAAALALGLCLLGGSVLGCTPVSQQLPAPTQTAFGNGQAVTLLALQDAQPLIAPEYGEKEQSAQAAAKGANGFAFRFTRALLEKTGEADNLICSPYSVWLPLAALLNATDEAYRPALLEALGAAGITPEQMNQAASRMLYGLTNQREKDWMAEEQASAKDDPAYDDSWFYQVHDPLQIANAVFVDQDKALNQSFAQAFRDYYRGEAMNVDFDDPAAVDAVNQWASQHTQGLIEHIVQKFPPETLAAIANAIYFSDRWDWEFDASETQTGIFHSPGGEQQAHFMLREGDNLTYYEDDLLQAMPLRFQTGGGLMILLPKDGDARALLQSMTEGYFQEIRQDAIYATGTLKLPRFTIESDAMDLMDALSALGVPLFDPETLPLTGLIQGESAYLAQAVQKAMIRVDEKGTTAAAVTVMAAAGAAMPQPTEPFSMICDRPFAFVLYGNTYDGGDQVLFCGVVNQVAE